MATRRRVLTILAASSASALAGLTGVSRALAGAGEPVVWRGRLMGAEAEIRAHHRDAGSARRAIAGAVAEVERLEGLFSLHRPDSAIRRLNETGRLAPAPREMRALLDLCVRLHAESSGAFDPSVQPLWQLYAAYFARADADPAGPPDNAVSAARSRVGLDKLLRGKDGFRFAQNGMALTLNGIAQGWITDVVHARLRVSGLTHTLINLGEHRALGPRPDGTAWRLGIAAPEAPWRVAEVMELPPGAALATSAGAGTPFDQAMRHHHLFDPESGASAHGYASVSVRAPSAALADGLSTALAVAGPAKTDAILARFPEAGALLIDAEGRIERRNRNQAERL